MVQSKKPKQPHPQAAVIAVAVICGILFGLPFLFYFLRMVARTFVPLSSQPVTYYFIFPQEFLADLVVVVLLGALAILPPVIMYLAKWRSGGEGPSRGFSNVELGCDQTQHTVSRDSEQFTSDPTKKLLDECKKVQPDFETVRRLLTQGGDVNAKDKMGTPLLIFAVRKSSAQLVATLIKHGADLTVNDVEGKTASDHAASHGNTAIKSILERAAQRAK
jgi:hypothetical protein